MVHLRRVRVRAIKKKTLKTGSSWVFLHSCMRTVQHVCIHNKKSAQRDLRGRGMPSQIYHIFTTDRSNEIGNEYFLNL
jgi:hypothetical protein